MGKSFCCCCCCCCCAELWSSGGDVADDDEKKLEPVPDIAEERHVDGDEQFTADRPPPPLNDNLPIADADVRSMLKKRCVVVSLFVSVFLFQSSSNE